MFLFVLCQYLINLFCLTEKTDVISIQFHSINPFNLPSPRKCRRKQMQDVRKHIKDVQHTGQEQEHTATGLAILCHKKREITLIYCCLCAFPV